MTLDVSQEIIADVKKNPSSIKTHVTIVLHINKNVEEKPTAHLLSVTNITWLASQTCSISVFYEQQKKSTSSISITHA